jgi:hypothetical protein
VSTRHTWPRRWVWCTKCAMLQHVGCFLIARLLPPATAGGSTSPPEPRLLHVNSRACSSLCGGGQCCSSVVWWGRIAPTVSRHMPLQSCHCSAELAAHTQLNGCCGVAGSMLLLMVPLIAPIWLPLLRLGYVQRVGCCAIPSGLLAGRRGVYVRHWRVIVERRRFLRYSLTALLAVQVCVSVVLSCAVCASACTYLFRAYMYVHILAKRPTLSRAQLGGPPELAGCSYMQLCAWLSHAMLSPVSDRDVAHMCSCEAARSMSLQPSKHICAAVAALVPRCASCRCRQHGHGLVHWVCLLLSAMLQVVLLLVGY